MTIATQQQKQNAIDTVNTLIPHFTSQNDIDTLNTLISDIKHSSYFNSNHARIIQRYQIKKIYDKKPI